MSNAGTDFLQLHRSAAPVRGLTDWLVRELRSAVADGRLPAGTELPPSRTLSTDLGVSRGVVVQAYQRLVDEGLLLTRTGSGTTVASVDRQPTVPPGEQAAEPPDVSVDLSPGLPDLAAFPRAAWLQAERAVLQSVRTSDLGYGDPRGSAALRGQLAGWLARTRGLRVEPGQIIVVAGVAQALALLAQTLYGRGVRRIAVEDPGSRGAREEMAHWGLEPVPVRVDEHGMDTAELSDSDLRAALLTPAHQFPIGAVLAPERRREVIAWACGTDGLIIEDDYDAEHRYDRAPVPALQASAPEHVAHTGSTSKTLAPGLRLGWLVPPAHLYDDLVRARYNSDLGSPAIGQLVLAELISSGAYDRHIRAVRSRQRVRRDAVVEALSRHVPDARIEGVAAGLHVVVTFPAAVDLDDAVLAERLRAAGILVQPLSWHRIKPGPPGIVVGYAAHPPDRLRQAVEAMAAPIRELTARRTARC
ncbi:MocR-like pyridoxine biosynthesis transcription factor PdxR [Nakamurella sp. GG22]